jgi:hypothetical protein
VSYNCFSLEKGFLQGVQLKSSARSALTEGSESKLLFSNPSEVKVGC